MLRNTLRSAALVRQFNSSSIRGFATAGQQEDVVVIGGGPGGYVAAIKAAQLGMKVTCVEGRGKLGGTCLNVGCIPSKALLNASHMYHEAKANFPNYGIKVPTVELDLPSMMKYKEKSVNGLTSGIEMLFKKNKVEYVKGYGKVTGPNSVEVALAEGGKKSINAKNIIIATGSDVASLPTMKIDEQSIISSTGALSLKQVPKKLVVIGGGVIGLELGSVWSRLGAETTVVEFTDRIAAGADGEIAKTFQKNLEKQHLKFHLTTKVASVEKQSNGSVVVTCESVGTGGFSGKIEADVVLVSVGRRPFTDGLGLKEAGVKMDDKGRVEVNEKLQTNVPSIWAIGDVIKGPMLAHKSEEEGIAVAEYLHSGHGHVNYDAIPSVIYTHPEVAWVGQTEEELKKKGVSYVVGKFPFKANSRARTNQDDEGMVKFIAEKETDKILGVHIVGTMAGELIGECVLAMEYGASSEDIARVCHAHPTLSEAVKEAAMATYDKPIHF